MAIVSLADIRREFRTMEISSTSQPSQDDVEGLITEVEAEVRSYVDQRDVPWPEDPNSQPYKWVKRTIIEGVRMNFLRIKYAGMPTLPDDIRVARINYNDRLRRVQFNLVPAAFWEESTRGQARYSGPTVGSSADSPYPGGSETLFDYVMRRSQVDRGAASQPRFPT